MINAVKAFSNVSLNNPHGPAKLSIYHLQSSVAASSRAEAMGCFKESRFEDFRHNHCNGLQDNFFPEEKLLLMLAPLPYLP